MRRHLTSQLTDNERRLIWERKQKSLCLKVNTRGPLISMRTLLFRLALRRRPCEEFPLYMHKKCVHTDRGGGGGRTDERLIPHVFIHLHVCAHRPSVSFILFARMHADGQSAVYIIISH